MTATAARAASKLETVKAAEAKLLLPTYERYPVYLSHGRGVYLYDGEGHKYLDFLTGIGVNALGHQHPAIRKALAAQAAKVVHISNLFYHEYQAAVAERLVRLSGLDRAFFCNSGSEACEAALKLARAYAQFKHKNKQGRAPWRYLALGNSFHGRTMGALAVTETKKYRAPFEPLVPGVRFVKCDDVADLKRKFDASVCAILLEVVQGEGGINPLSQEFMNTARALTKKTGALLICDEIQCGLGRTGVAFAYQKFGIKPDIVTVAKPLASGLPLGAVLCTESVSQAFHPSMHGTTFGGGPLACAVAAAFLDQLTETNLMAQVAKVGGYFKRRLDELAAKHSSIRKVRGLGLMLGVELDSADRAKAVLKEMLQRGVLLSRTHDVVMRFLPPFIITEEHVDEAVKALDASLAVPFQPASGQKTKARKS